MRSYTRPVTSRAGVPGTVNLTDACAPSVAVEYVHACCVYGSRMVQYTRGNSPAKTQMNRPAIACMVWYGANSVLPAQLRTA